MTFSLRNEQGTPWLLPLFQGLATIFPDPTGIIVLASPGYTVQTWETSGVGTRTSEGWGLYSSTNAVFVSTIVRQIIPGQPQAEADASLASCGNSISVPFDYRNGFSTGVALVNNGGQATVVATIYSANGIKLSENLLDMVAKEHIAFSISERFPVPAGQLGSVGFVRIGSMGAGDALCGLAFQFNPTGNFSTTHFAIIQ